MRLDQDLDLVTHLVQTLYSAECQLILALPRVASRAQSADLQAALREHHEETRTHAARLDALAKALGIPSYGHQSHAMEGLLKEGDEALGMGGAEHRIDAVLIGACQAVEHYEISQYRQLLAALDVAGLSQGSDGIRQTLREEEKASKTLEKSLGGLANSPRRDSQAVAR